LVVGIGASAGGLEAFSKLLGALPLDTGMAFVLVQHLDPAHESVLPELLARTTSLPVGGIEHGTKVEANRVYVIPQNTGLAIKRGVLRLSPRPAKHHRPIDDFLRSLAEDMGHRAIGVILSGTASDGTLGLEAIQAEGGVTFAQDEASARFHSMPHSAAAAGTVDFVLPPEKIAQELMRLSREPYLTNPPSNAQITSGKKGDSSSDPSTDEAGFKRILHLLHDARGVDFSSYRSSTIRRRIHRRMVLDKIPSLQNYAERLRAHAPELEALYQDLLIGVTSFFRDANTFEFLQRKVFPELIKNRAADETVRIWVSGCSTGQEAYSLAMVFLEFASSAEVNVPLQIFATDLNETKLETARAGFYAKGLVHDVSIERLRRFFSELNGVYRINKSVRECVVFARHNVFADPSFSRMDMVSCRNLLIYLEPSLQQQVIPTFHYSLKPEGVLVLGASETVGRHSDLFVALDNRCKVYSKLQAAHHPRRLTATYVVSPLPANTSAQQSVAMPRPEDPQREADRLVISRYAPAGVVIDDTLEILQFRGATGAFLAPANGKARFNLLTMALDGLMLPLRDLTERVKQEQRGVRQENVRFRRDGQLASVHLEVMPLKQSGRMLVLFETPASQTLSKTSSLKTKPKKIEADFETRCVEDLEHELEYLKQEMLETRGYFQLVQEQGEATTEELQATNEEAHSANEELQSLIEELETSKEELESSNEEMRTINEELSGRNTELRQLDSDHQNFVSSVELAIVLIGADLRVRQSTPQAELLLGVQSSDIGRPIGHVRHSLEQIDLEVLVRQVIRSATAFEGEVHQNSTGRWLLMRIRPYTTRDGQTDGAVLVVFDIDALKRAEFERERLQQETEMVFESLRDGVFALNHDWIVTYANQAAARISHVPLEAMQNANFWTLFPESLGSTIEEHYRSAMRERTTTEFEAYYAPRALWIETKIVPIETGLTVLTRDVTESHLAAAALDEVHQKLQALSESQRRFLADAAHEVRTPLTVIQGNLDILERYPNISLEERIEVVAESAHSATRLVRLANDLLALARGDAGDHLRLERLELAPLLMETLTEATHLSSGQNLEAGRLEPCQVFGDRDKLKQLVLVLLDNALKYTPPDGHVSLTLLVNDGWAEFRVLDTGAGIAKSDLERVFERFYRTDTSRSRQTGGTGLGLPIARWIAEQHGGSVWLESELGIGTTAIARMPLAAVED
jgi:two-component system CheB/CheR fusion protein